MNWLRHLDKLKGKTICNDSIFAEYANFPLNLNCVWLAKEQLKNFEPQNSTSKDTILFYSAFSFYLSRVFTKLSFEVDGLSYVPVEEPI